ncbi:MAG: hypothetical protein MUP47_03745 [Phycisphaerae bacterium]|nr:hypothetical protein [Phycisphaerae bacterium]
MSGPIPSLPQRLPWPGVHLHFVACSCRGTGRACEGKGSKTVAVSYDRWIEAGRPTTADEYLVRTRGLANTTARPPGVGL